MSRGQIGWCQLRKFHRLIGKAVWGLQYLEVALDQLITLKVDLRTPGRLSVEEALAKLERHQRDTLGISLKKAKQQDVLDPQLQARLEALNDGRGWLIHRSLTHNGDDLYDGAARKAVIERIRTFTVETHALHRAVSLEIEKFTRSFGIDTQAIGQAEEANLQALRKGRGGNPFHDLRRRLTGRRTQ